MSANRATVAVVPLAVLIATGVAAAGSWGGGAVGPIPVFALCVAVAFVIQWVAFVPAYLGHDERFYDLVGSLTCIAVITLAALLGPGRGGRTILLLVLVLVWAARLGPFLFVRARKAGGDTRFVGIKQSLGRYLSAWTLQGLWVSLTLAAALAAVTATGRQGLDALAAIGGVIWAVGFALESVADLQKARFRANPANKGRFIGTGLWSWSRHPNYFGEIVVWVGIAVISLPALHGSQLVTLISPVFVTVLLTCVSGIPPLERRADERWGGRDDYEAYKRRTPLLVPLPPAISRGRAARAARGGRP